MSTSSSHFVCLPCRASCKKAAGYGRRLANVCPRCGGQLLSAGSALAVPPRRDRAGWRALAAVLTAGLRFHQDCCGCGPGYRPRTPREVKDLLAYGVRTGTSPARALAQGDPYGDDVRQRVGRGGFAPRSGGTRRARGRGR